MSKDKGVVNFGPDEEYLKKIDEVKKAATPVGGAPMPKIPRLDQQPNPDRHVGVQQPRKKSAVLSDEEAAALQAQGKFIPGIGSGYVANQPALRGGQAVEPPAQEGNVMTPSQPRPEGSGLSQTTVQLLQQAADQAKVEGAKEASERAKQEKEQAKIESEVAELEKDFDYDEFGNLVIDVLNNPKRRDSIELRCAPLSLRDMLINQEVRQKVPIVPGEFEPVFRTTTGREDLYVKKRMSGEKGSDPYLLSKMAIMNLVTGWYAINGSMLPMHIVNGVVEDAAFDAKLEAILNYPVPILADLAANYTWFERRCRRLLVIEDIKGF